MPLVTIPKNIEGMNKSERYILNKLKLLYMVEPSITYLYLEPQIKNLSPDFILIDPNRGVIIIEVKAWSIDYFQTINHKNITTIKGEILENPTYKARRYFNTLQGLFRLTEALVDKSNKLKFKLHSVVAFTELRKEEVKKNNLQDFFNHYPARVLYSDELRKLKKIDEVFHYDVAKIEASIIGAIRSSIFPEIKIKKSKTLLSNGLFDEKIIALDIEQERFIKNIPFGHYMITGIPGSGKTVAVIARAIYLAKLFPDWKILIVTYNKSLKNQIKFKVESIKNDLEMLDVNIANIEVSTFHQIALKFSSLSPSNYKKNSESFWRDILPNNAIKNSKPYYDAILVDEYQDFYKNWFELLLKLIKEYKDLDNKVAKNIFISGDRLQSIYNPKELNWKQDIGLDMRGRSKLLKTSYRVTKEHIELGLSLLKNDKKYRDEVSLFYEGGKKIFLQNSKRNSIDILESENDGLVSKIEKLLEEYNYEDIILLAPTWDRLNNIKKDLPEEIQNNIISSKEILAKKMIFTTYYSAKGIESKVSIVVDVDTIKDRKLLYVASTRASSKLVLHGVNFKNSIIGKEILSILVNSNININ